MLARWMKYCNNSPTGVHVSILSVLQPICHLFKSPPWLPIILRLVAYPPDLGLSSARLPLPTPALSVG